MKHRHYEQPKVKTSEDRMKITMTACSASPQGIAKPGTVLDLPEAKAKELVEGNYARPYEHERDAKKPHGLQRPPETFDR